MKNKLKYIYLSIVATLIFVFTFTLVNTKTYAYTYNEQTDTIISDNLVQLEDKTISGSGYFYNKYNLINPLQQGVYSLSLDFNGGEYLQLGFFDNNNNRVADTITRAINGRNLFENITTTGIATKITIYTNNTSGGTISNIMLNSGATALPYEPYGTYINENVYNDYVDTHSHTNTEYQTLEEQYNTLQDNYDTLEEQYNQIYNTLQQFEMWKSYGAFTYLDYANFYGGDIDENYTLQEMIQEQIITGNVVNITTYFKDRDVSDNNSGVDFYFKDGYYTINNANVAFYDFHPTTTSFCAITMNISNTSRSFYIPMTDIRWNNETKSGYNLTSTYLKNYFETNNIDIAPTDYIEKISLGNVDIYDNIDYENILVIYPIDIDSYNTGYNNGYDDGILSQKPLLDSLQEQVATLQEQVNNLNQEIINKQSQIEGKNGQIEQMQTRINSLQQSITQLQQQYDTLRTNYDDLVERYNRITGSDNDLYQMIIAVADTPITIFKQIFNFDVLGINISGFVTMIISLLVIIWLIKKII